MSLGRRSAKTTTHGLGDTLDVVTKNLAVALGTALSETLYDSEISTTRILKNAWGTHLSTLATARHFEFKK